jgi:hypothetical protein
MDGTGARTDFMSRIASIELVGQGTGAFAAEICRTLLWRVSAFSVSPVNNTVKRAVL